MRDFVAAAALRAWRKVWRPFAVAAFRFRSSRREKRRFPTLWRTDAQIVRVDLEYAAEDEIEKFDKTVFDNVVSMRDRISSQLSKLLLFGSTTFLVQLSFVAQLDMDSTIFGFKITNKPGIAEALLVVSSTIMFRTLQLQARFEALNSAVVWGVGRVFPPSLKSLLNIAYDNNSFGKYYSSNIPHYTHRPMQIYIGMAAANLFLVALLIALSAIIYTNYLIFMSIWDAQRMGWWSIAACGYAFLALAGGAAYLLLTRFPMPYRDWSNLHYMEMVRQFHPEVEHQALAKEYAEDNADKDAMKARGYPVD